MLWRRGRRLPWQGPPAPDRGERPAGPGRAAPASRAVPASSHRVCLNTWENTASAWGPILTAPGPPLRLQTLAEAMRTPGFDGRLIEKVCFHNCLRLLEGTRPVGLHSNELQNDISFSPACLASGLKRSLAETTLETAPGNFPPWLYLVTRQTIDPANIFIGRANQPEPVHASKQDRAASARLLGIISHERQR